jgi:hypothetical protein
MANKSQNKEKQNINFKVKYINDSSIRRIYETRAPHLLETSTSDSITEE